MKLLLKGGKIINKGFKGIVMDLYNNNSNNNNSNNNNSNNNNSDNFTLYNELKYTNPDKITLFTLNKQKEIDNKYINDILILIKKNNKNTLVKKFAVNSFIFGSNKNNFFNEFNSYKSLISIFKKNISKYTTIKKGFTYNNNDIYAISFNNNYYIFLEKCFKTLDNIDFNPKLINKCIKDIFEILFILYKNNFIHNDIKPDNIILCKNRFKIIDWESSNFIKDQASTFINSKNGNLVFNHPIKFYKINLPYIAYKFIYDQEFLTYKYLLNLKSPIFIMQQIYKNFDKVIDLYNKDNNYFLKIADLYAFAISIVYIAEKNNITDYNKTIINKILAFYFFDKSI